MMAVRWFAGLVAGLAFVVGLVCQLWVLAICGLLALAAAVVVRPAGINPLSVAYRDVRPVDQSREW